MAIKALAAPPPRNDASLLPGAPPEASQPAPVEPKTVAAPTPVPIGASFQPFSLALGMFRTKAGAKWTNQQVAVTIKADQGVNQPSIALVLTKAEIYALKQLCAKVDEALDAVEQFGGKSVLRLKIGRWLIPNSVPKLSGAKPVSIHLELHKAGVRATLARDKAVAYTVNPRSCTVDFCDTTALRGFYLIGEAITSGDAPVKPEPTKPELPAAKLDFDQPGSVKEILPATISGNDSEAAMMAQQLL